MWSVWVGVCEADEAQQSGPAITRAGRLLPKASGAMSIGGMVNVCLRLWSVNGVSAWVSRSDGENLRCGSKTVVDCNHRTMCRLFPFIAYFPFGARVLARLHMSLYCGADATT
jgi:hypothetical protein